VTEDEITDYMHQLLRRENGGERATLEIGPYTAMLLLGAVHWALRHGQFAEHGPRMFERLTDQLQLMFIDDPTGQQIIRQHQTGSGT
jgi:hypothetical protein